MRHTDGVDEDARFVLWNDIILEIVYFLDIIKTRFQVLTSKSTSKIDSNNQIDGSKKCEPRSSPQHTLKFQTVSEHSMNNKPYTLSTFDWHNISGCTKVLVQVPSKSKNISFGRKIFLCVCCLRKMIPSSIYTWLLIARSKIIDTIPPCTNCCTMKRRNQVDTQILSDMMDRYLLVCSNLNRKSGESKEWNVGWELAELISLNLQSKFINVFTPGYRTCSTTQAEKWITNRIKTISHSCSYEMPVQPSMNIT